jgi:small-conductance mechanosensitive channel
LARKIRVGDFVELETGQRGYVVDIGWRSTQIRELPNNMVIVPNARIAEIIVKNFALPEAPQAALVQVGVAYGSDLEEVERVTIATAREIQQTVSGADEAFEPFIRFHTFGDSAVSFTVILRVKEFVDRYLVTHEFMKRLHRRYAEVGIEIPFPQRVLHFPEGHPGLSEETRAT